MRYLFWSGPIVFLVAEILLPGGSSDIGKRIEIIQTHTARWEWGHLLIIVALFLMLPWLAQIYREARKGNPPLAFIGVFTTAIAIIANYAIAVLQLLSLEIVQELAETAPAVLGLINRPNLMVTVFLPFLGFLIGFVLLATSLWQSRQRWIAGSLLLSGLFISLAGLLQSKPLFVLAALGLVVSSAFISQSAESAPAQKHYAKT